MQRISSLFAVILFAAVLYCPPAFSHSPEIRDIDITLTLLPDGSASIHERWDVCAADGTEWYLVRSNLGDIEVGGLSVSDESGLDYICEDGWDTERSLAEKAGRCGILRKRDGAELCWGIGSHGDHVFDVRYTMSRCVKSLNDYDMLHLQTVSPGLSSPPRHVRVTVRAQGHQLDTANTRAWGFGYEGRVDFRDGAVVFESSEPFVRNSSVIVLLRFDKGMFSSPSMQDRDFSEALAVAMEGADFGGHGSDGSEAGSGFARLLALFVLGIVAMTGIGVWHRSSVRRKILGMKPSEVGWCRDIPFGGDLEASAYTLEKLGEHAGRDTLAAALILRMIYKGQLSVSKDDRGRVELSFGSPTASGDGRYDPSGKESGRDSVGKVGASDGSAAGHAGDLSGGHSGSPAGMIGSRRGDDPSAEDLREMMLEASGSDRVLQHKEFSRWAGRHTHEVAGWSRRALVHGRDALRDGGLIYGSAYTSSGSAEARKLLGLKKFLQDFTLMGEKDAIEAVLWQEYLVFGALFGIADKVAEQLKEINPEAFAEVMDYDYPTMHQLLLQTRILSAAITNSNAAVAAENAGSARGLGGGSSFGGGGGFSGGGFGGGSR